MDHWGRLRLCGFLEWPGLSLAGLISTTSHPLIVQALARNRQLLIHSTILTRFILSRSVYLNHVMNHNFFCMHESTVLDYN